MIITKIQKTGIVIPSRTLSGSQNHGRHKEKTHPALDATGKHGILNI
jgi:hypothetical protein